MVSFLGWPSGPSVKAVGFELKHQTIMGLKSAAFDHPVTLLWPGGTEAVPPRLAIFASHACTELAYASDMHADIQGLRRRAAYDFGDQVEPTGRSD